MFAFALPSPSLLAHGMFIENSCTCFTKKWTNSSKFDTKIHLCLGNSKYKFRYRSIYELYSVSFSHPSQKSPATKLSRIFRLWNCLKVLLVLWEFSFQLKTGFHLKITTFCVQFSLMKSFKWVPVQSPFKARSNDPHSCPVQCFIN